MEQDRTAVDILRSARGIAFDCYGTLLSLGDDRGVTRRAIRLLSRGGTLSPATANIGMDKALAAAGVDAETIDRFSRDAAAEADGAILLRGARFATLAARGTGRRVAIASNLSREYADPIRRLLPGIDACLSFEAGCAKPDPRFYQILCHMMDLEPSEVVMIGDSRRCDHDGPIAAGMSAILLGDPVDGIATMRNVSALPALLGAATRP